MEQILEMHDIYKSFGPVEVLKGIHFGLNKGEVHALLGANGAGKSTLIKIIGGVHTQNSGEITLNGEPVSFKNNYDSMLNGISVIYQELSLVPTLTVMENMFLGREMRTKGGFLKKSQMQREYEAICAELDFEINGNILVSDLSIAKQQMVEIMKAVSRNAEVLIMDEPTTSLTKNEKESLFQIIRRLKAAGKSIIYISHLLDEIFLVCDRASIMRNGEMVGCYPVADLTKAKITALMTGNDSHEIIQHKSFNTADYNKPPVLEVHSLSRKNIIHDINFKVYPGEVVGLAGLVGSKRTEIINCIFGIDRKDEGEILIHGKPVNISSPPSAIAHKIGLIPEDRKNLGLILGQEIYKNATAIQLDEFKTNFFLDQGKEISFAEQGVRQLGIALNNVSQKARELSGGNQQKVVVSKWLGKDLDLIIYDEPTKGIDIAAKEDIFKTVETFAGTGMGILFISSDLDEVVRISDRVLVIRDGAIVGEVQGDKLNVPSIMDIIFDVEGA